MQTKLQIGEPDDPYERAADAAADAVMRMPLDADANASALGNTSDSVIQRMCAECEEEEKLRRQPEDEDETDVQTAPVPGGVPKVDAQLESRIGALRGTGAPLPVAERKFFEPRFGHDFSRVRVHTGVAADTAARSLRARAFTTGNDVVFGNGHFAPNTEPGLRLLAHELTHVVQQGGGGPAKVQRQTVPEPDTAPRPGGTTLPYREAQEEAARERIGPPSPASSPSRKKTCLTFDDGPEPGTEDVLNALGSDVKATFFLTGKNLRSDPERQASLLARILAANHQIGNHTLEHDPEKKSQYKALQKQPTSEQEKVIKGGFEQNRAYFETLVKEQPEPFRKQGIEKFPGFSLARLPGHGKFFPIFVAMTKSLNLTHVGWDMEIAPTGLVKATRSEKEKQREATKPEWPGLEGIDAEGADAPKDKSILLLHDRDWTGKEKLLRDLITRMRAPEGGSFEFGTLNASGACE